VPYAGPAQQPAQRGGTTAGVPKPGGDGVGPTEDRAVHFHPEHLALSPLGRAAQRLDIGALPGDEPSIRRGLALQPTRDPRGAGGAEPAVSVEHHQWCRSPGSICSIHSGSLSDASDAATET
jgi:hypothetical protein